MIVKSMLTHLCAVRILDEQEDGSKRTILMDAVQACSLNDPFDENFRAIVSSLIEKGARTDLGDQYGRTALFYAVKKKRNHAVAMVSLLLKIMTPEAINKTDTWNYATALSHAVDVSKEDFVRQECCENLFGISEEVVELLIQKGARLDAWGRTALSAIKLIPYLPNLFTLLFTNTEKSVAQELLIPACKEILAAKKVKGDTFYRDEHLTKLLDLIIERGAQLDTCDAEKKTALSIAIEAEDLQLVYVLVSRSSKKAIGTAYLRARESKSIIVDFLRGAGGQKYAEQEESKRNLFYVVLGSTAYVATIWGLATYYGDGPAAYRHRDWWRWLLRDSWKSILPGRSTNS